MKLQAIVYSSVTGFTAQYAQLLSAKTGLPAYTLAQAQQTLPKGARVLYMSWLMAGTLVDYKKAAAAFEVAAACSVGLNATPEQAEATKKSMKLRHDLPFFALQGGYRPDKLQGMYKWMMKLVTRVIIKKIEALPQKGAAEEEMLRVLRNGGSFVKEENLSNVLAFLQE